MLMYVLANIGSLEATGLVILFGLSAVGAIIIVRDVLIELKKMYINKSKGIKEHDEED